MFHKNGEFKQFGVGKDKTIYPFWLVTIVIGVLMNLETVRRIVICRNDK